MLFLNILTFMLKDLENHLKIDSLAPWKNVSEDMIERLISLAPLNNVDV
jgi:hypothetical protein